MKIEKIYSKIDKNKLLHIVCRFEDTIAPYRENIIDEDEFLQCSVMSFSEGKTFKAHKHIYKNRSYDNQIAQESWVVIKGSVRCIFYDLDDTILATPILNQGDSSFTLHGGHNYEILEDNTIVYEYKTGPYEGQKFDKTFILGEET